MRKLILSLLTIALGMLAHDSFAQCNSELYGEKSMKNISPGFLYEKTYRIDGKDGAKRKIEYSTVLSKDINYCFSMNTKDGGSNGMIFQLFDGQRNVVATNYINDKFFSKLEYKCKSTGLYFLSFTFKESQSHCGAAVLAFKR